jgi:hypothetical protein
MGPHGLALAAASGARPSGSKVNGAVGLTALAQHIVVVAGNRLDREGCGLRAMSGSKENTSCEARIALSVLIAQAGQKGDPGLASDGNLANVG